MWAWSQLISLFFKRRQKSGFSVKLLDFTGLGSILFKHTHEVGRQNTSTDWNGTQALRTRGKTSSLCFGLNVGIPLLARGLGRGATWSPVRWLRPSRVSRSEAAAGSRVLESGPGCPAQINHQVTVFLATCCPSGCHTVR